MNFPSLCSTVDISKELHKLFFDCNLEVVNLAPSFDWGLWDRGGHTINTDQLSYRLKNKVNLFINQPLETISICIVLRVFQPYSVISKKSTLRLRFEHTWVVVTTCTVFTKVMCMLCFFVSSPSKNKDKNIKVASVFSSSKSKTTYTEQ